MLARFAGRLVFVAKLRAPPEVGRFVHAAVHLYANEAGVAVVNAKGRGTAELFAWLPSHARTDDRRALKARGPRELRCVVDAALFAVETGLRVEGVAARVAQALVDKGGEVSALASIAGVDLAADLRADFAFG